MIGVPILAGVLRDEARAGLVGGICGLLLSLADSEGPLWPRLKMLLLVSAGILAGGYLGFWIKGLHGLFWFAFFAAAFGAGLLNEIGKGPHFAVRFGAIAFAALAGLPSVDLSAVLYFAGVVLLAVVVRTADDVINGPLGWSGPWAGAAELERLGWIRFALAYALAATVGLWIGIATGQVRAVWVSAITLVVMLPNPQATFTRVIDGVVGTAVAVVATFILTSISASPLFICGIILLTAFFLPSQLPRFWAFSSMIAVIVLLAWDLASGDPTLEPTLLLERLFDMLIGAGLALAGTAFAFPRSMLVSTPRA